MKSFYKPLSSGMLLFVFLLSITCVRAEPLLVCSISLGQGVKVVDEEADGAGPAAFAGGRILAAAQREKMDLAVSLEINVDLGEQAYRIVRDGRSITVTGGDPRGVMYGGLEVAERVRLGGLDALDGALNKPYIAKRGIKFNIPLDSRTPSFADNGDAARNNIAEMWNWEFWTEFLDNMALHRFTAITLWNPHPFPTMTKIPGYEDAALSDVAVCTLDLATERDQLASSQLVSRPTMENLEVVKTMSIEDKIAFWRKVTRYGKDRGVDFYFITWNICANGVASPVEPGYRSWEVERGVEKPGKYGITHQIDNPKTLAYYRAAVKAFLLTYPDWKGIGVTAGEHMPKDVESLSPTREQWLWEAYGLGVLDAKKESPGREVDFIHRVWYSDMNKIMEYWNQYPDPFEVSFKYAKARLYSSPRQPFVDSMLKDLQPHGLKSWWNLRNDDIFYHRWGDPDYTRTFLQNFPKDFTAGYHMGSDGYVWGREFVSKDENLSGELEIAKHWYQFMLWGRLGYDPTLDRAFFEDVLADHFPGVNAGALFSAWQDASRIIPLVNRFHWRDWDFMWSVEGCRANNGYRTIVDFLDNPTMEESGILNPINYVDARLAKEPITQTTPLDIADQLDEAARGALFDLNVIDGERTPELNATKQDIRAMALLGRFYACKIRASVALGFFKRTGEQARHQETVDLLLEGQTFWTAYTSLNQTRYHSQVLARLGPLDWEQARLDVENEIRMVMKLSE